jgi:hypothetical protein
MKLHQLSVFVETGAGQLRAHSEALRAAGIDIVAASLADTPRYGVLRLIVKDWRRAKAVLEATGAVVSVSEVVPVEVDARPGGLSEALVALADAGLGIEYMYDLAPRAAAAGKTAVVFRFEDPDRAVAAIRERGIRFVDAQELGSA